MTTARCLLTALAAVLLAVSPTGAQTWTAVADGFWSDPLNWTSLPVSNAGTQLTFPNVRGVAYTATNDLGNPFILNAITADNEFSATNTAIAGAITLANAPGNSLQFAGANAAFTQNGPGNVVVSNSVLDVSVPVTFNGPGVGAASVNAQITGAGPLTVNRPTYVPGLASVFFGNAATPNTFTGGVNLQAGALAVAASNGLGSGPVSVATTGAGLLANGDLRATQASVALPNDIVLAPGATLNAVTGNGLTFAGPISGAGGVNFGNTLQPYVATFTGGNTYDGGTTLTSAALTLSGGGTIAPATNATNLVALFRGSALSLNNATTALPTRLGGANVILAMNRADFNFVGNAGTATGQAIATIDGRGQNVVRVTPAAGGAQLSAGNYNRLDRGTVFFGVVGVGATLGGPAGANVANVTLGTINGQPAANSLVGGGGAAGSPTVSIVPFFMADNIPSGNGNSFATVDANGVRPLNVATEYASALPLAAYQSNAAANVRFTQPTGGLTVPTTVNAVVVNGTGSGLFNAGTSAATLAVGSGAVLASGGNPVHVAVAGLDFGTREGVITSAVSPVLVSSAVTGSNGVTVNGGASGAGFETRLLNPANGFTGPVTVNFGVLSILDDAALGNAANGVTLSGGALRSMGFDATIARPINVTVAGGSVQVSPNSLSLVPSTISQGAVLTLTGAITGLGPLHFNDDGGTNVTGAGEIRLQGNAAGYGGTPFLSGGLLRFDSDARLGTGNRLVLNGGTLYPSGPAVTISRTVEVASTSFVRTDAGDSLTFTGPLRAGSGAAGLVKLGTGSLTLRNVATYGGGTAVGLFAPLTAISTEFVPGGDVTLADAGALTNTAVVTVAQGSRLILDNAASNVPNRVNDGALTLAGGGLRMTGNAAQPTSERFGPLVVPLDLGASIDLASAGGQTLTATFSNSATVANPLARSAGATLVIAGPGLGTQSVVRFAAPTAPTLSGNVLPGVFGVDGGTPVMVTAPQVAGVATVRPLTAGEYTSSFAGAATTADVRPAAPEAVGTQTVNSVNFAGGATATIQAGATLTVTSGNVIVTPSATLAGGGTVTGGSADGLHVYAAGTAADVIPFGPTVGGTRLNKTGPAVLAVQAVDPSLTTFNVHAGTLRLPAGGAIASIPILRVQAGATFETSGSDFGVGQLGGLGTVDTGAGALTVTPVGAAGAFGGTLLGAGGLVKAGPGTLTLTPTANVPGPINVTGGALVVGNTVSPFVLVPQFAGAPVTLADGTAIQFNAVRDVARSISVGNSTLDFIGGNSQPSSTVSGTVTIAAGKTLNVSGSSAGQVRLAGLVTGPGTLNLNSGNFVLAGANDHAGGTLVNTTALVSIANDAAFGGAAGPVTFAGSGLTLAAQGGSRTLANPVAINADVQAVGVGRLTLAGDATLGGSGTARQVTVNSSGGLSLANVDGPAGLQLTKAGGGTLILAGTSPYAGTTAVASGTVLVPTGAAKTGTAGVEVGGNAAGSALATLGGGGSLAGPVTVNASGIVAPGDSPGTLTLTGGLAMAAGATYVWELAANTTGGPGTVWDRVSLTGGDLALSPAARFVPSFIGTATVPSLAEPFWQVPQTWQNVIDLTGTATNTSGNALLAIDNTFWASAGSFSTQLNGMSVMLVWTPVPEPLHAFSLAVLALAVRPAVKRAARGRMATAEVE